MVGRFVSLAFPALSSTRTHLEWIYCMCGCPCVQALQAESVLLFGLYSSNRVDWHRFHAHWTIFVMHPSGGQYSRLQSRSRSLAIHQHLTAQEYNISTSNLCWIVLGRSLWDYGHPPLDFGQNITKIKRRCFTAHECQRSEWNYPIQVNMSDVIMTSSTLAKEGIELTTTATK